MTASRAAALALGFSACAVSAPSPTSPVGSGGAGQGAGGTAAASGMAGAVATGGAPGTGGSATGTGGLSGTGGTAGGAGSITSSHGGAAGGAAGNGGTAGGAAGGKTGAAGAGVAQAGPGCAGKTYKLCDDFEAGTAGSLGPMWTKYNGYGTPGPTDVGLAADAAHSGTMSLKSDSIHRGQQRARRSLTSLGATASLHWGRIFYKVQQPSPAPQKTATNTVIHITWTSLLGPAGENRVVDVVENMAGAHQWLFNIPSDKCCTSSAYNWRFDGNWHCAEWWVDVATNSYRFFADSVEVPQLAFTGKTNSTMSQYTDVILGATWYQQDGTISSPFVIWFDDLAIDDTRIGCD